MQISGAAAAREYGHSLRQKIQETRIHEAYAYLAPVLAERTLFRLLDLVGETIAGIPFKQLLPFLDLISVHRTEGGWVVIASALKPSLAENPHSVFPAAYRFIILADIWYACDIFGERVLGNALVENLSSSLAKLEPWQQDANRWIRRALGVAGHYWAKRTRGNIDLIKQAEELLSFFQPMLSEKNIDAAKGVGWALKTLGRYYPSLIRDLLFNQDKLNRPIAAVIRRKALKFLPAEMQTELKGK